MMTEKLPINSFLLQAILNYLTTQPYAEVHQLIAELQGEAASAQALVAEPNTGE